MGDHQHPDAISEDSQDLDLETVPTSAGDIASAGRSCMAILILIGIIVVLLVVWFVVRSFGANP